MIAAAVTLRPRYARVGGGLWLATGAALVLAGLVVLLDQHRLGWELPVGLVGGALGWWLWHRHLVVDAHGIEQQVGWHRSRLLWGVVDAVEVLPSGLLGAPVRVHLAGRDPVVLTAAWGLSHAQREVLARAVDPARDLDEPSPA